MNIKRKVARRIATWFLCLAMVLTTINLPAFTVAVSADTGDEEIVPVLEGDAELSYNGKERIFVITNIDENVVKYNISRIADAGDSYREAYDSESGTLTITATNVCKFEVKFEKKDGTYWSDGNQYKIIELKINRLIIPLPYYDDIVEATGSNTIITRVRYSYLGIEAIRVEAVAETGVSCVKNPSDHMSEENKYYIISTTSTGIKKVKFSLTDTRNLVWEDGEVNERIKEYEVVDKICTSATRYHIFSSDCDAICNVCGYERVASNTHNFVDQGNGNHKCSTCGSVEGHEFADQGDGNHKCTKCDSQGTHDMTSFSYDESSHTLMCSFCGFTNPRIYGKPFHSFGEWRNGTRSCKCGKTEVCDHDGITTGICSNCGIEFSHVKGTLHEAKPATCETDGTIEYYECAGCGLLLDGNGNEISDITDESALGHSFTNYKSDNNATCTLDGTKTAKCDRCDVTDTKADTGSATGIHDFSQNGTCVCGLIQIEFEIINDDEKTVRVTGLNKDFDMTHDLFIPSTVEVNGEDYSVTEISVQAFWECNITGEVVIPDSVITIGNYAFSGCGNIERISIPCTIDPYEIYWGIDCEKIVQRSHDFSNGALKCNLCGTCKALSENGKHDFNDEFKCTNCGQVDQFGVYFSQYKDLVIVENDDNKPWAWDMDKQSLVPDNVDSYAYSSMTITAKKRVKISFSYSFDKAPHGEDMLFIKRTTKEGDYEEYEERYPSDYNGEYPYDRGNRDPLILYPGDTLQIDYRFGSEYMDEGIRLGEFKIDEITYVEIKGMSLELDPVYGEYIGVNLYIDASDNASLYFDDMPVTPDGEEVKLVIDDNTGIKKIQYRCAVKEFADIHKLVACDGDGNTIDLSIDQYTDVEEFTYSGMSYCDAVLAGGTVYSDELEDVCNALIEFNEQARNYFEYNNDGLNVGSVTADIPTTGYEASMTGKLPEGCSYIGSSLVLEEQLVLRHYFVGNIGNEAISCVDTTNNKAVEITTGNTADDRITYVDIVAPYSQIADMYKVIIEEGETAYTLTYGVLTYCNKAYELGQNSELVNTCNAMYNYSVAVNAYFSIGQ